MFSGVESGWFYKLDRVPVDVAWNCTLYFFS